VQVVRLHGSNEEYTSERCSLVDGRRELTSAECKALSSLLDVSFEINIHLDEVIESGCIQWTDALNTLQYMINVDEHLCVSNYCYCAYDTPPSPPGIPPS
jgi:hypothetical protein